MLALIKSQRFLITKGKVEYSTSKYWHQISWEASTIFWTDERRGHKEGLGGGEHSRGEVATLS